MASGGEEVRVEVVGVFEPRWEGPAEGAASSGFSEQALPLLVLRDVRDRELHVPVSPCEGLAIQLTLGQHIVPRPLTHDLAVRLLESFSSRLTRVVVHEFAGGIYYAKLFLHSAEGEVSVEARPGDAVALALRMEAPIYATEGVLMRGHRPGGDETF